MEALEPAGVLSVDDLDLLNFSSEEDDDDDKIKAPSSSFVEANPKSNDPDDQRRSCPELIEEDLEWLSNKDAFPAVETCFEILSGNPGIVPNHHSPVSVLENSSNSSNSTITSCCGSVLAPTRVPVRARSKRRRRRRRGFSDFPLHHQCWWWSQPSIKNIKPELPLPLPLPLPPPPPTATGGAIGRRCQHCQAEKTPQWRAGPMGPKTLCNACGVRYKSGRLVPEYRPASSPTFSNVLHSNSHRKVVEMRKQKQLGGMVVNEACGYRVG